MITEIEVEGIGIMRHMNAFQIRRASRIADRTNRAIAMAAFGIGLTVQDFKKLNAEQQKQVWDAYNRLSMPAACVPRQPDVQFPARLKRLSEAEKADYGRRLIEVKSSLPHGHFQRWVEDKSGITYGQALRYMKAARSAA